MKEKYIKKLIRLVEDSKIESLEVSSWGRRVKITQHLPVSPNGNSEQSAVFQQMTQAPQPAQPPQAMSEQIHPPVPSPPAENTSQYVEIKSPMVGTFYAAPAPDADPYVSLNEKISVGQVVCIVEAMKLMNEIESEVSGRIVKILVKNAEPVEYGQTLFLVDPD